MHELYNSIYAGDENMTIHHLDACWPPFYGILISHSVINPGSFRELIKFQEIGVLDLATTDGAIILAKCSILIF